MIPRCLHSDHSADPTVFGACPCDNPQPQRTLPRFIPSWRFVVPETSEGVAAADLQSELDRLERPYERVLGPDELEG